MRNYWNYEYDILYTESPRNITKELIKEFKKAVGYKE